jgi:3-hydroxyacyl-[acyl-carrier-protein] dehydratase
MQPPEMDAGGPWREADGTIRASACFGAGSPWFDGHFPGDPILPGIALLALVCDTLAAAGGGLRLAGLRRVRFKQVVRPGDRLEISVSPKSGGGEASFSFRVQVAGAAVCSGTLDMV